MNIVLIDQVKGKVSLQQNEGKLNNEFALTIQNVKHSDITNRFGDYSTQIRVPNTSFNNYALGGLKGLNSKSHQKIEGFIEVQGVSISNGYFKILSFNKKEIVLRFYGGSAGALDAVRETNLRDIDMTEYNFLFNIDNVIAKSSSTSGIKTYFTGMPQNQSAGGNLFHVLSYNVGTYVKTIFEKFGQQYKVKFGGKLFDETSFPYLMTSGVSDVSLNLPKVEIKEDTRKKNSTSYIEGEAAFAPLFPSLIGGDYDGRRFTASAPNTGVNFSQTIVTAYIDADKFEYTLTRKINGIDVPDIVGDMVVQYEDFGRYRQWFVPNIPNDAMIEGDFIELKFRVKSGNGYSNGIITNTDYKIGPVWGCHSSTSISLLNTQVPVAISETLPDMSFYDLIKELLVFYNMSLEYDNKTGIYNFVDYERTSKSSDKAVILDEMVDVSKPIEYNVESMTRNYGQLSTFNFAEVSKEEYFHYTANLLSRNKTTFGGGSLTIEDNSIPDQIVKHESKFQTSVMALQSPVNLSNTSAANWLFHQENRFDSEIVDGVEEFKFLSPKPKLLISAGVVPIPQISRGGFTDMIVFGDNLSSIITEIGIAYCTKPEVLGMDQESVVLNDIQEQIAFDDWFGQLSSNSSYFSRFYRNTEKILNKGITMKLNILLSPTFINTIDFSVPYIYKGLRYKLETIDQFKSSTRSTKCVFVKI
jgi:hypothetical protein